jgi:NAD(P)-dependent dehydrogenase (short-subunit alcohol dehydrogenase family)
MKKTAIVTGAGRGIGRATAVELAQKGYALALLARTESELRETAKLTAAADCLVVPTDVADSAAVQSAVDQTMSRFGRVDAVINCAGYAPRLLIEEVTDAVWREVIDVNLSSAFYLCRAAWPIFRKQKSGAAVLVSSMAARDPLPGFCAYGPAKAAVNLLGLSLAREGAEIGVRVHVVAPGATETAMLRSIATIEQFPTERTMAPADVARVIVACIEGDLIHTNGEAIYLQK